MYYYQIQDVNGQIVEDSSAAYDTGNDAANAAKDRLITRLGFISFPVEIRISDMPPGESTRYFSSTYYMDDAMVREYWREKIEEANRQELADILINTQKESDALRDQFSRGLLTPLDYAKYQESLWIRTRFDIESKG